MMELTDEELTDLYKWVDSIPLSKPKKNIARDFADGVQVAELVKHFFPKLVELHNFAGCNNTKTKMKNWETLNRKVFKKLGFELDSELIEDLANCKPGVVEKVLSKLRSKIDYALYHMKHHPRRENDKPEADQVYNSPKGKGSRRHRSPPRGNNIDVITTQNLGSCLTSSDESYSDDGTISLSQWPEPIVPQQMTTTGPPRPTVPYFSGPESDAVSSLMFQEKVQESLSKDETIQILQAKIQRLEHLLHLKDLKINELQDRHDELRPTMQTKKRQNFR